MELGFDSVLLNSALAQSCDSVAMARAFRLAIDARDMAEQEKAVAATPVTVQPFAL